MHKYSICITHYNNIKTVKTALESLISQIDDRFDVTVVDNLSTDGSRQVLRHYAAQGRIGLIESRCSRGLGRQISFVHSDGDYVIANIDMDDILTPRLQELIDFYHGNSEGKLLLALAGRKDWNQNITIGPRSLVSKLGGWRDLQIGEDWDLWSRAAKLGLYLWTVFPLCRRMDEHGERRPTISRLLLRYESFRDSLRLGRRPFNEGEKSSMGQKAVLIVAKALNRFYVSYRDPFNRTFDPYSEKYFIGTTSVETRELEGFDEPSNI